MNTIHQILAYADDVICKRLTNYRNKRNGNRAVARYKNTARRRRKICISGSINSKQDKKVKEINYEFFETYMQK